MIAGVIRLGPSQLKPWNGSANVFEATPTWYSPSRTRSKANVPSAAVVVVCSLPPSARRSSTVTPSSPTSSVSTSPGVPPPGLKSRQTTPVMPPWNGSGSTASTASSGMSGARIAVRPSSATSPGSSGVSSVKPLSVEPVTSSVDGRAVVSTPGSVTISWTADDGGVDRAALGILLVHDPPDHADREQRDGERDEDGDLEGRRPADSLRQHREDEPDRGDAERDDEHPEDVVLDRGLDALVREHALVVVEPDEARRPGRRRGSGPSSRWSGRRSRRRGRRSRARGTRAAAASCRHRRRLRRGRSSLAWRELRPDCGTAQDRLRR